MALLSLSFSPRSDGTENDDEVISLLKSRSTPRGGREEKREERMSSLDPPVLCHELFFTLVMCLFVLCGNLRYLLANDRAGM